MKGENKNYGYSIKEAAKRFGLDEEKMQKYVESRYKEMNVMPVCVLCSERELEGDPCGGISLEAGLLRECPYMNISDETIDEFKLKSNE